MIKSLFTIITALAFIIFQVTFLSEVGCLVTRGEQGIMCHNSSYWRISLQVEWEWIIIFCFIITDKSVLRVFFPRLRFFRKYVIFETSITQISGISSTAIRYQLDIVYYPILWNIYENFQTVDGLGKEISEWNDSSLISHKDFILYLFASIQFPKACSLVPIGHLCCVWMSRNCQWC